MQKKKIAILGLGAVGGYLGAHLAAKYKSSNDTGIIFITREKTKKIISEKGLKLITPSEEKIVFPHRVVTNTENIGTIDFLICTVKSYDLEESLLPLKSCITSETIILPLLNGVDAKERIAALFPLAGVWEGCVYIISRLTEPAVVRESGNIHSFFFGSSSAQPGKLKEFESILQNAGIDCRLSDHIRQTVWEKFLFISVVASSTSYLGLAIGPILQNSAHLGLVKELLSEIIAIADAKKIALPENIAEKTIAKMESMPFETTSSMHSDFQKGGKTEYRSLTEYVVNEGKRLGVKTPMYEMVLEKLKGI